jgi:CheY-like chemotaxis protein
MGSQTAVVSTDDAIESENCQIILVADDELDEEEIRDWVNLAGLQPRPELLFAPDKTSLFELLAEKAKAGTGLPRIVFLDLNLKSKRFGLEALKDLKSTESYAQIPVVIYSQSSDPDDIRVTNELHANSYLTKGAGDTQGQRFADALKYWLSLDHFCGAQDDEY